MKDEYINLTKDDFKFFKKEVKIWLEILGMTDFKIDIQFLKSSPEYAMTLGSNPQTQRQYLIALGSKWENEYANMHLTKKELEKIKRKTLIEVAHHESMEAFYYRLRTLCMERFISEKDVDDTIHSMIHKMEGAWDRFLEKKKELQKYGK